MMENKVIPCPNCKQETRYTIGADDDGFYIRCTRCNYKISGYGELEEAEDEWERMNGKTD